jgi:hypothetical protein
VPTLKTEQGPASSYTAKVTVLKERFYPTTYADLSDIGTDSAKAAFKVEQSTTIEKITTIFASCSSSSAPGDDEIPFSFLKALGDPIAKALTLLTNASLKLIHLPPFLKKARTIMLRKPGKASYEAAGSWRPIALFKTIGKVIKKVITKRIRAAAEVKSFLPPS